MHMLGSVVYTCNITFPFVLVFVLFKHMVSPWWASYFSLHAQSKVTKRKGTHGQFAPSGSPHPPPLPTGRLDSPSGLDKAKSDVRVGFSLPKAKASANFTGKDPSPVSSPKPVLSQPKWTASLAGSIDHGRPIGSCRAGMRVKTTRGRGAV
jgi:hypothetical protein